MNWKIEFLKRIDSVFGTVACTVARALVRPRRVSHQSSDTPALRIAELFPEATILVIRPGGIGDAALLLPALEALSTEFPAGSIDVLAEKRNGGLFEGCPFIDRVYLYDRRPPLELLKALRGGYDIVIDTEQWHRLSALVAYLCRAPIRVGFATNGRASMFSHPVGYSHRDYEARSFLSLVTAVTGVEYGFDADSSFITPRSVGDNEALTELETLRGECSAVVALFPGATVPERRWGVENFTDLGRKLTGQGVGVVIVGGKTEAAVAGKLSAGVGGDYVLNLAGRTSLNETASVLKKADLFITGDSGLLHIAYGVGTPTVSLFGAGIQEKWAPPGKGHIALNKRLECSPCTLYGYTPRCPYDIECLRLISVDEVYSSAMALIKAKASV
ncbi:MAG: glycosyltransferase family 9 protein [Thermodesulfobacteriota bacterium]